MQSPVNRAEQSHLSDFAAHIAPMSAPLPHPVLRYHETHDYKAARKVWCALALFWVGIVVGVVTSW
jgi:Na+(H+)/acetate symporter ActP